MDSQQMYLISTAESHPTNTLTHFTNNIPISAGIFTAPTSSHHRPHNKGEIWEMALLEIAFSRQFLNKYTPANPKLPSVMILPSVYMDNTTPKPDENLKKSDALAMASWFEHDMSKYGEIFMPHRPMDVFEFYRYFGSSENNPTELIMFFQRSTNIFSLYYPSQYKSLHRLVIHKLLAGFLFGKTFTDYYKLMNKAGKMHRRIIDGELFYELNMETYPTSTAMPTHVRVILNIDEDFLPTCAPSIVRVECDSIAQQYFSNNMSNTIEVMTLPTPPLGKMTDEDSNGYYTYEPIRNPRFFPLTTQQLKTLTISLLDVHGERLKLADAAPTIAKVLIRKIGGSIKQISMQEQSLIIHVHSDTKLFKDNTKSDFKVRLPAPIQFQNESWFVALTGVSFSTRFKHGWSEEDRTIKITIPGEPKPFTVVLPDVSHSVEELAYAISHQTKGQILGSVNRRGGGERGRLSMNLTRFKQKLQSVSRTTTFIEMSAKMHYFLGGKNITTTTPTGGIVIFIGDIKNNIYTWGEGGPRYNLRHPDVLFIYSNIVQKSPVGGDLLPILRVVPLTKNQLTRGYSTMEFKHLDFQPIVLNNVHELEFSIRQQDGSLIPFNDLPEEPIVLTLLFTNNPTNH